MAALKVYLKLVCVIRRNRNAIRVDDRKKISAMVRVKNEAEYLKASLDSIVDLVDEIIIIDNRSTDSTPTVIDDFVRNHGEKARAFSYDHDVLPVGSDEYKHEAETPASPRLTSSYYNHCLGLCSHEYVMKWDGDMIALPRLAGALDRFRAASRKRTLYFEGISVHPDGRHSISESSIMEARVFPKGTSSFVPMAAYEAIRGSDILFGLCVWRPCYLHMKFAKRNWRPRPVPRAFLPLSRDARVALSRVAAR